MTLLFDWCYSPRLESHAWSSHFGVICQIDIQSTIVSLSMFYMDTHPLIIQSYRVLGRDHTNTPDLSRHALLLDYCDLDVDFDLYGEKIAD